MMTTHSDRTETLRAPFATPNPPDAAVFTDSRREEDVRAALRRDPRIKHPELIAASVDEIGTVVLHGAVGTLPERLAAAHDARDVEGVFEVVLDDLKVHPSVGRRRTDDDAATVAGVVGVTNQIEIR